VCVRAAVAAGIRIICKFFLFRSAFDIEFIHGLLNLTPMYLMIIFGFTIITQHWRHRLIVPPFVLRVTQITVQIQSLGVSDYRGKNYSIITQMMSIFS
jgi:hypothetical protein